MNITAFFVNLGAPLRNNLWSWGSVRESDGAVFLRVWQDRKFVENRRIFMMVVNYDKHGDADWNNGYEERLKHLELVKNGAPCYLIMCEVVDPDASPREIKGYDERTIRVGGELVKRGENLYIALVDRKPVAAVRPRRR